MMMKKMMPWLVVAVAMIAGVVVSASMFEKKPKEASIYDDEFNSPTLNPRWRWKGQDKELSLSRRRGFVALTTSVYSEWEDPAWPTNKTYLAINHRAKPDRISFGRVVSTKRLTIKNL